jgi:excisionase family DNA binding protein
MAARMNHFVQISEASVETSSDLIVAAPVVLGGRHIMALHDTTPPRFTCDPIEPLLDVSRAAHLLGISVKTLRDWIQGRRIDYVKVGTIVMIRPETIRQFVTSNTRSAAG